jgi:hypothetical protein
MKTQQTMEILGVVNRGDGKAAFWTRIGTAFLNRDGRAFTVRAASTPSIDANVSAA